MGLYRYIVFFYYEVHKVHEEKASSGDKIGSLFCKSHYE